jgi:hypothetical protein
MKKSEFRQLIREEISKVLKKSLKENQLSDIVNQLMNAPKGSKATGGGYGPFIKISSNSWKNTKSNSLQHSRALADFIGGFSDFKISSSTNESKLRSTIRQFIKEGEETNDIDTTETPSAEPQLYVITYAYRTGKPDYDDYDFAYETIKAKSSSDALAQARKMFGGGLTINSSIEINTDATKHARAKLAKMSKEK